MKKQGKGVTRCFRYGLCLGIAALGGSAALAADEALLIQMEKNGKFRVWHVEGATHLTEQELGLLEANAQPEGSDALVTDHGPARAYWTPEGIIVRLPEAKSDKALLLDHPACSELKAWHAEGETQLTENQLSDLVGSALPDGGPTITVGGFQAKAFLTRLGVTATLWKKVSRTR